jgi:hypothetical protein
MSTLTSIEFPSSLLGSPEIYTDGNPTMSFGMVIQPIRSEPVTITALRWFAAAGVTVRPRIWSAAGSLLASGPAVVCVAGWNTLPLLVPHVLQQGAAVVAGVYQTGGISYPAKSESLPLIGSLVLSAYGRFNLEGDGINSGHAARSAWYGIDIIASSVVETIPEVVVNPVNAAGGSGVYAEASRQMAAVILLDSLQLMDVGAPATVGFNVTRSLTPTGLPISGLVQTTTLANAVESRTDNTYSIKLSQGTDIKAGQAVKVLFCRQEPDLAGKVLLIDKVSQNGMAMLRKAVASDFDMVNQEGKGGLNV